MLDKESIIVVIGASDNTSRYSYMATTRLQQNGYKVIPIGIKKGEINGTKIVNEPSLFENVHTVTLYIGPAKQPAYYDYVINLKPKRLIFNPGTENKEFYDLATKNGIEAIEACTLVMLSTQTF
jgi:predicted CoA-binding protein